LVFGKGLLFGVNPVFVESSEGIFVEFLGPNGGESSQTSGGFDVSDDSDNDHGRAFNDGDGFNDFFFVVFGTGSFDVSKDVGHTSFESGEGGHVTGLAGVIFGE